MNPLTKCKEAFSDARKSVFEGIALLWEISEKKLWEAGGYSGLGEYVEQELQLHPTAASRYLSSYKHFVIEGKQKFSMLKSIDPDKLYAVMKLPLSPEEQITRAQTWNRSEIQDEVREAKAGRHDHDWYEVHLRQCKVCGQREKIL